MNERVAMPKTLEALLTIAAAAIGIAFYASVSYWPKEWTERPVLPNIAALKGPSVLASLRPAPVLNLTLPDDVAIVVRRTGINGETGLIPTAASITTYRLVATGDLVSVAAPTGVDPVVVRGEPDYRIHGRPAVESSSRGVTLIRWTENGVTYEVSSRTLTAAALAEVANKLR
jgi:hypothetical protein